MAAASCGRKLKSFTSFHNRAMKMMGYVDPGLGLLAWQSAVAGFIGALFYMRKTRDLVFRAATKVLGRKRRKSQTAEGGE